MPKGVYPHKQPWNKGLNKSDPRVQKNLDARNKTMQEKYGSTSYNNTEKRKATCLERYGEDNVTKAPEIKARLGTAITAGMLKKYGVARASMLAEVKEKALHTFRERYGVSSPSLLPGVGEKISASRGSEEAINKSIQTCIDRYGVPYVSQIAGVRDKARATLKERYGNENYVNSQKAFETMQNNGTLRSHKTGIEAMYETKLRELFGDEDVVYQYRSEAYPFKADFYIRSLDLYIELHAYFSHGGRPYDPNDPICQEQLARWTEKAEEGHNQYKVCIYTWTDLDVRKVQVAVENNINLVVIYPQEKGEDIVYSYLKK